VYLKDAGAYCYNGKPKPCGCVEYLNAKKLVTIIKKSLMEIKKIKETCLYVTDLERSRSFYENKLGLPVIGEVKGRHIFFRAGASVLLCFIPDMSKKGGTLPPHYGSGQLHLAFEVSREDYGSWKNKVEEAGISIEQEYDWGRGYLSFYFRDPDKNLLEVVMEGMWDKTSAYS
jgi:catechol 2,3-dioxygenase-like lactoylglutathione lyase family enzyme